MHHATVICARCGCRSALNSYCCECGSPLVRASDPVPNVARVTNGPPPLQPVQTRRGHGSSVRNVVVGLLLIVLAVTFFFVYMITRPDPNGHYGFDPSSSDRALYYMRKEVRSIAAARGFRDITFCDGGSVTRPGPFVYLVNSCFEGDAGGRFRVPFFAQMDRTPPDGQTYSLLQFKVGQVEPVTPPFITDSGGRTPPIPRPAAVGTFYSEYLNAEGGYTLPGLNAVSIRPGYGWVQLKGSLPPGLTEKLVNKPCLQKDMEQCALLISGTPTQPGTFTFTEQVTNYNGKNTYSSQQSVTIIVNPSSNGSDTSDKSHAVGANCAQRIPVTRTSGQKAAPLNAPVRSRCLSRFVGQLRCGADSGLLLFPSRRV